MTLEEIKELISIMDESSLSSLNVTNGDFSLALEKAGAAAPVMAAPVPVAAPAPAAAAAPAEAAPAAPAAVEGDVITSPMVGTFYTAPSPDSPAFVKAGSTISKGDKICIIEAMKIFNEIEAELDGTILEILVEDGQVVEYDTPLFRVEKK